MPGLGALLRVLLQDCAGAGLPSATAVRENELLAHVSGHPLDLGLLSLGIETEERIRSSPALSDSKSGMLGGNFNQADT